MTPHTHTTPVPGCFRCELGRDEVFDALATERDDLRRAIVEHRTAITNAGDIRVDDRDLPAAQAKHAADQLLWDQVER